MPLCGDVGKDDRGAAPLMVRRRLVLEPRGLSLLVRVEREHAPILQTQRQFQFLESLA
jgi:hypothetical protein